MKKLLFILFISTCIVSCGSNARKSCEICRGTGSCYHCKGLGTRSTYVNGNTGYVEHQCFQCYGTGFCSECGGDGYIND